MNPDNAYLAAWDAAEHECWEQGRDYVAVHFWHGFLIVAG